MASTGRNTTFILLIMLSIVVFLFLNMVLGSVRIPMSAVWHIFTEKTEVAEGYSADAT